MLRPYRFVLDKDICELDMQKGAEILSAEIIKEGDNEIISLYALVDDSAPKERRKFLLFGTGANMDDTSNFERKFIGTVIRKNQWACHIFEVKD